MSCDFYQVGRIASDVETDARVIEGAYGHNEVVKVRTDDEVIQSRITAIKIDSGSSMAEYTCGELPTKLTDIIKGDK